MAKPATVILKITQLREQGKRFYGYIRHRGRFSTSGQRARLVDIDCVAIVEEKSAGTQRAVWMRLLRSGDVGAVVHMFLIGDPKSRYKKGGIRRDMLATLRTIEDRGASLLEVDTGWHSANARERDLMVERAIDMATTGGRGIRSAETGATSKGRPRRSFSDEDLRKAEMVWLATSKFPTWEDAKRALPKGFNVARAFKLWGARGTPSGPKPTKKRKSR